MSHTTRFSLPSKLPDRAVFEALRNHWVLGPEGRVKSERVYLDTVDLRVERAGWTLVCEAGASPPVRLTLSRTGEDNPVVQLDAGRPPAWGWDLPQGPEWAKIRAAIGERRILDRLSVSTSGERLAVLDSEQKTTARVLLERHTVRSYGENGARLVRLASVVPVRGYDKSASAAAKVLTGAGLRPVKDLVTAASARRAARKAGDIALDRNTPIATAVSAVLGALREEMLANEAGVRVQLDTEFLHEYRVAARCARSVLRQVQELLPEASVKVLLEELRWLGTLTGPARDIDVHLLYLRDSGADVEPLRRLLGEKREEAQSRLVEVLDSDRYRELLDAWRLLERNAAAGSRRAAGRRPSGPVVDDYVRNAHRRVLRAGRRIDDESPPEALHDLRKKAKALRYLLETFQPLYPSSGWKAVVSELKALQDNLGEFQDCQVQGSELRALEQELAARGATTDKSLRAMGRMVSSLDERETAARAAFAARFKRFSSKQVTGRLKLLYGDARS